MGKVQWFKEYVQGIQDEFNEINRNKVLVVKSQVTKYLNDHSSSNNLLLLGILPDFKGKGDNADEFKLINVTQLMVLKKTTYSEYNYDEFLEIYEETYIVIEKILEKLLQDSRKCNELRFLNPNTIALEPIFNMESCNGWKLMFNFDMFV